MNRLLKLAALIAGLYGVGLVAVLVLQPRLVYFPGPPPGGTPSSLGVEGREVTLRTEDGESLGAWFLPAPDPVGAVVFSHGNAGNIEGRLAAARSLVEMGFSVLLYDYRGFGASTGTPGESGTYLDAEAAYDWMTDQGGFVPARVVAYGRSLGGAVAMELALRRPVAGLMIECTFTSIPDMAARLYPWIPLGWFPGIEYDNLSKISEVKVPIAIAHSPDDELVPVSMGTDLAHAARAPIQWIDGAGGHNSPGALIQPAARKLAERFLRSVVSD